MPVPSTSDLARIHRLDGWPWAQPWAARPIWETVDGGESPWDAPWTGYVLGSLGRPGRRRRRTKIGPITLEQYFGIKPVSGLGDFGISAGITGIITAIAAGAAAAGGVASALSTIIGNLKKLERQEIKDARAAGATPAEIRRIRQDFRRRRAKERKKAAAARRKARQMKRRGAGPRAAKRAARQAARRQKRAAAKRKRAAMTPAEKHRQVAQHTQQAAAGIAMAGDILQRVSAGAQEMEFGSSIDPTTGQHVIHRGRTDIMPTIPGGTWGPGRVGPPGTGPFPPAGPGVMDFLRTAGPGGIPYWAFGVGLIGGGALLLRRRR